MAIFIKHLVDEKSNYFLLKQSTRNTKHMSKGTQVYQDDQGLIKLTIFNGYGLVKLVILI